MTSQTSEYRFHPAAAIFPEILGEEFDQLVEDIREHGLREPIVLDHEKRVLDGRNRLRACSAAGVEPRFTTYEGDDPTAFVISMNIRRRHLTASQKATFAAELLPHLEEQAKARQREHRGTAPGKSARSEDENENTSAKVCGSVSEGEAAEQAAKVTGTNRKYVRDAKRLKEEAPEEFEAVRSGAKSLAAAKRDSLRAQPSAPTPKRTPRPRADLLLSLDGIPKLDPSTVSRLKSGGSLLVRADTPKLAELVTKMPEGLTYRGLFTVLADQPVRKKITGRWMNIWSTSIAWMTRGKSTSLETELDDVLKGYGLATADEPLPNDLLVDLMDGLCPKDGTVACLGRSTDSVAEAVRSTNRTYLNPSSKRSTAKPRRPRSSKTKKESVT